MFGPLAAASEVFETRSTRGFVLGSMVMGLVSSLAWVAYGIYLKEVPSIVTNILGILSSAIQFSLYSWARKAERNDQDRLQQKKEL